MSCRAVGPDPEGGAPVIADGQSVLRVTYADAFGADDEQRAHERRVGAADMIPATAPEENQGM